MRSVWVNPPLAVVLLAGALLAGCIGAEDDLISDNAIYEGPDYPVFPAPEKVEGFSLLAGLSLDNPNELTLRDNYAYLSGESMSYIIDITDPAAPVEVSRVQCTGVHVRTVQLEGRLLMTLSSQADDNCPDAHPAGGLRLVDVTDPDYPEIGPQVPLPFGSHTHTQYNDTGIIWNSAYNLPTRFTEHQSVEPHMRAEIIDVSNWSDPKVVDEFVFPVGSLSIGCHDIWPDPERERAYCAAISETQIWDVSDPRSPQILSTVVNPLITIHHTATISEDGTVLIIGDEWTGALGPGCFDGGTAPIGSLWFYDIRDVTDPQLLSYFAPPHLGPGIPCTAHNFNVIEGHDVLVSAFFTGGTALIDFSDPTQPTLIDHHRPDDTDVWASYYHNGHVFTGDRGRGLDVLTFTGAHEGHDDCLMALASLGCLLPNRS